MFDLVDNARTLAHLHGGTDVPNGNLPGQDAWRIIVTRALLNAEVDGVRAEGDELGILVPFVDHREGREPRKRPVQRRGPGR